MEDETKQPEPGQVEAPTNDQPDWSVKGPQLEQELAAIKGQLSAVQQDYDNAKQDHNDYKLAALNGLADPEGYEAAKWQYSRLASDGKPTFGDWLQGLQNGSMPIPKALAGFYGKPGTAAPVGAEAPLPKPVVPSSVAGTGISSNVTSEQLRAARAKAARGDTAELKALLGKK